MQASSAEVGRWGSRVARQIYLVPGMEVDGRQGTGLGVIQISQGGGKHSGSCAL